MVDKKALSSETFFFYLISRFIWPPWQLYLVQWFLTFPTPGTPIPKDIVLSTQPAKDVYVERTNTIVIRWIICLLLDL